MPLVDVAAVKAAQFKVVVDGVNSSGGIIIPKLLELMGVEVVNYTVSQTDIFLIIQSL
jgi:phosphomannomutase